jgi:hypothetical protein
MKVICSVLAAILLLGGCGREEPEPPVVLPPPADTAPKGVFKLTVVPTWGTSPLQLFTEYRNYMDQRVTVELLKLYFGELEMVRNTGMVALSDVIYMNLAAGPVSHYWRVDTGMWNGLQTHLGIPDGLNMSDPSLYGAGHPLNVNNGTYWTWATGYRFAMFEGRYDLDPGSTAPLVNAFVFHPGRAFCYLPLSFSPTGGIAVAEGDTAELRVMVDVEKFFHSSAGQIDLATENQDHGGVPALALKMATNIQLSMSVE